MLSCFKVNTTDILVINDTLKDDRFAQSPHVTGEPFIRFYAGLPLIYQGNDGVDYAIGAMSLIDVRPRKLNMNQMKQFKDLSSIVNGELSILSSGSRKRK